MVKHTIWKMKISCVLTMCHSVHWGTEEYIAGLSLRHSQVQYKLSLRVKVVTLRNLKKTNAKFLLKMMIYKVHIKYICKSPVIHQRLGGWLLP